MCLSRAKSIALCENKVVWKILRKKGDSPYASPIYPYRWIPENTHTALGTLCFSGGHVNEGVFHSFEFIEDAFLETESFYRHDEQLKVGMFVIPRNCTPVFKGVYGLHNRPSYASRELRFTGITFTLTPIGWETLLNMRGCWAKTDEELEKMKERGTDINDKDRQMIDDYIEWRRGIRETAEKYKDL